MYEGTELDLVTGGMAAAGGLDGVIGCVKIAGAAVQVDGDRGIGTGVGQGIGAAAAIQGVGAGQSFDDVGFSVAGQDVVVCRTDDVCKVAQCVAPRHVLCGHYRPH